MQQKIYRHQQACFNLYWILSSLIIYAKLGSIWGCKPSLLSSVQITDIHKVWGWPLSVLIPVAMQYLIGDFSWGPRLAPPCSFFEENFLPDDNLLITSMLLKLVGYQMLPIRQGK